MNFKKLITIIVSGVMLLSLSGCVNQHPDSKNNSSNSEENRLVATSVSISQICDKLDIDLVGICESSNELPKRYENVTKVGMPMNPDLEILKSLNPDYVISPTTLKNDLEPKYSSSGIDSLFLNLKSLEGMYASISDLGKKFGKEEQAKKLVDEFNTFMEDYKSKNAGKQQPKVLILMGLPGSYIVATESSYVGNLVNLAGGINVYSDGDGQEFLSVNTEDMKSKEPDIILRTAHALPEQVKKMFADEFEKNDIWKHFKAVENGKVYDLDASLFNMSANFRYTEALQQLQGILYNE